MVMNKEHSLPVLRVLFPFAVLALAVIVLPVPVFSNPVTRILTLDARQFEFAPARVEVNQGDTVIITVRADDVVHGFYLDGYGLETRIQPGVNQEIKFVANRVGKFRYRCSVTCGPMHPFMIGELVVGPNTFFWRILALTFIVAVGAMFALLSSGNKPFERIRL
jgi:cytochrome c oxidase subunit II